MSCWRMFQIGIYIAVACILPTALFGSEVGGGITDSSMNMVDSNSTGDIVSPWNDISSHPGAAATNSITSPRLSIGVRSVRLNTYNNYKFSNDNGWNTSQMYAVLARKDNVMVSESWPLAVPSSVKAINPATRFYCIYTLSVKAGFDVDGPVNGGSCHQVCPLTTAEIDAYDWWLRDGNGQKVLEAGTSCFLDVGKPGFKEAYLSALLARMPGRSLDGIVFDYWNPGLRTSHIGSYIAGRPLPAAYPTDQAWFTKAWQPFIQYVMAGVRKAGYRVIGNCVGEFNSGDPRCDWQRLFVDGAVYEQWAVDWPGNNGAWLPGSTIDARIKHMASDPMEVWTADYGLQVSDPLYEQKEKVGLSMYYIAMPATQTFRSYNQYADSKVYWENIWDFRLGVPSASYVKMSGMYFWSRRFTQGLVLLNYESSQSVRYMLDRRYLDANGHKLTGSIIVAPHTGLILAAAN